MNYDGECLCVAADVVDSMGCIFEPPLYDTKTMINYIDKCLYGDDRPYHPGHRDCDCTFKHVDVDEDRYDPRGIRSQVVAKYVDSKKFWLFHCEEKRFTNKLLLYRWQRGGPTVFLKSLSYYETDFRSSREPDKALGICIPLACIWPLVFVDKTAHASNIKKFNTSPFQILHQHFANMFSMNKLVLLYSNFFDFLAAMSATRLCIWNIHISCEHNKFAWHSEQ